jgi:hypothetical protein
MCTLAVTAQLGGAQMWELNEHIAACASCRKVLESLAQVSLQAMPSSLCLKGVLIVAISGASLESIPAFGRKRRFRPWFR